MKQYLKQGIAALAVLIGVQTTVYAGGKGVALANSPVAEIPEMYDPNPWYIGVGFVGLHYYGCSNTCEFEDDTYGLMLRGGYEYNQYVGVEARAKWTGWDDEGAPMDHHIGIFLKPMMPLGEDFNAYALLGYGQTKIAGSYKTAIIDQSGFSWGVGLEYDLSGKESDREANTRYDRGFDGQADQESGWGLFIDYQKLLVNPTNAIGYKVDLDVVTVGITYDF